MPCRCGFINQCNEGDEDCTDGEHPDRGDFDGSCGFEFFKEYGAQCPADRGDLHPDDAHRASAHVRPFVIGEEADGDGDDEDAQAQAGIEALFEDDGAEQYRPDGHGEAQDGGPAGGEFSNAEDGEGVPKENIGYGEQKYFDEVAFAEFKGEAFVVQPQGEDNCTTPHGDGAVVKRGDFCEGKFHHRPVCAPAQG